MPRGESSVELLTLHGVRICGFPSVRQVATLYDLDPAEVEEYLLDAEAYGQARRTDFAGQCGWSLTERGREHDERLLARELDDSGGRAEVTAAHRAFLPLNHRLGELMTRWQIRPTPQDRAAPNDHRDAGYDDRVAAALGRLIEDLRPVTTAVTAVLPRFGVHQPRLDHALTQVQALRNAWVDSIEVPSVNLVWIQLHEDLLATLGIARGDERPAEVRPG